MTIEYFDTPKRMPLEGTDWENEHYIVRVEYGDYDNWVIAVIDKIEFMDKSTVKYTWRIIRSDGTVSENQTESYSFCNPENLKTTFMTVIGRLID